MSSSSPCKVAEVRGGLYLMGDDVDAVAKLALSATQENAIPNDWISRRESRDGSHYHTTLLTKSEMKTATTTLEETSTSDSNSLEQFSKSFLNDCTQRSKDWFVVGLGQDPKKKTFFLVIVYPRGAALRRKLGLPQKGFHITLGFGEEGDVHECDKGHRSILWPQPWSSGSCAAVSTPTELVEAANELVFGGNPCTQVKDPETVKKDFPGANSLLDAAAAAFAPMGDLESVVQQIESLSVCGLEILRDILHLRCILKGRRGDFEKVSEYALCLLGVEERIFKTAKPNSTRDKKEEDAHIQMEASAEGYRGFSLAQLGRYSEALPCLERSYELRVREKGSEASIGTNKPSRMTFAEKQSYQEAIAVEKMLGICCQKMGVNPPLPPLTKFSRTEHLFDAGGTAVSSDDLVISGDSAVLRVLGDGISQVIIEEKIDGANMGLSMSASGKVIAQNRSHYVSAGDHGQFGPLAPWLELHQPALSNILMPPEHKGRAPSQGLILFGEWVVARHSIPYHKLPGHFVAFDLFDRLEKRFYSRSRFHEALRGSGIPVVPVIDVRTFGPYTRAVFNANTGASKKMNPFERDLRSLLESKSRFRDDGGTVEGVVLRVDSSVGDGNHGWLEHRMKIVRPDFVAGCAEGHWLRRDIDRQRVDQSFADEYTADCYPLAPPETPLDTNQSENEGVNQPSLRYKDGESCHHETINPRRRLVVSYDNKSVMLPRNFSWLYNGEIAVSSTPVEQEHITALKEAFNISLVVTLTLEGELPSTWFGSVDGCKNLFVPVENYMPPTVAQMDRIMVAIVESVSSGNAALEHCGGGKGRAGTVAACLLLRFGIRKSILEAIAEEESAGTQGGAKISSDDAINHVRKIRPGSIETEAQERFIREYADLLWKRAGVTELEDPMTIAETPAPSANGPETPTKTNKKTKAEEKAERERVAAQTRAQRRAPRYVMLMGLPGSGKSTFSERLSIPSLPSQGGGQRGNNTKDGSSWVVINQDKLGRKACVDLAGRKANGRNRIILDRCHVTAAERAEWVGVLRSPRKGDISLVYLATDVETCATRVANRKGHETIPEGRGGRIVREMSQKLEPPTAQEEKTMFGSIHVLRTDEEIDSLLRLWGAI